MTMRHEGGCVCGAIRFVTMGLPERVSLCHCTWCQRRTGTAFGTEAVFKDENVVFSGAAPSVYRHISDLSGRWLDQAFCGRCGSNLGLTLEAVPGIRSIAAGTFDDPSWLDPATTPFRHLFLRSDCGWADVPAGMERHEMHFRK
jgi:hypothetical protein